MQQRFEDIASKFFNWAILIFGEKENFQQKLI